MHMWNWFTGARPGTHISISSSTAFKFYYLFAFKAKNTHITSRRKKPQQYIFFPRQSWVTAPPLPPTQLNPVPGQPESCEEIKCTCQHPPLLLQPRTVLEPEDMARSGILAVPFLRWTVKQSRVCSAWWKLWKGNTLKVPSTEFSHQSSELWDTRLRA